MRLALKTASYGISHIAVATAVAFVLTGNLAASISIGLIEPIVQTGVFTVHEYFWESRRPRQSERQMGRQVDRQVDRRAERQANKPVFAAC